MLNGVSSLVPEHSVIMTTISKHSNVKTFTEKLLLLLNRGGEFVVLLWGRCRVQLMVTQGEEPGAPEGLGCGMRGAGELEARAGSGASRRVTGCIAEDGAV